MRNLILTILLVTTATPLIAQAQGNSAATSTPNITPEQLARLERAETKLKDWPNLGRYREANARVAPPAKGEDRVVFMGDSITDSWKLAEYFPGMSYINRGISGQTTPQMLIRFRPDVIALRPRVVVILAGTNDLAGNTGPMSLETIQNNLESMVELAHTNGIRVVLASIMPINDYAVRDGKPVIRSVVRPPGKIIALNKWIKDHAAAKGAVYLDYFSAMVDEKGFLKAELSHDGLHATPEGYRVMKLLAEQAIYVALKKKQNK